VTVLAGVQERLRASSFYTGTLSHFKNYLGGTLALQALSLVSLPLMTRLLTQSEYGTFAVFLSSVNMLTVVLTLNSHVAVGRYFYEKSVDFPRFVGTSVSLTLLIMGGSTALFLLFGAAIASRLHLSRPLLAFIPLFVLVTLAESLFLQIHQPLRQSRNIALVSIVKAYGGFALSVVLVLLLTRERYRGLIWAQLAAGLAASAYYLVKTAPYVAPAFELRYVRRIFAYCLPLIPYALSSVILDQFDRIMINSYKGPAEAGLYSLAYNIGLLLNVFVGALYQAWLPNYFEHMNRQEYHAIDAAVGKMYRLILCAATVLVFFGPDIGALLAGPRFHGALRIVPVVALGYATYAIFPIYGWGMGFAYRTIWVSLVVLAAGALNIVLNALFIPRYGAAAAAYATLCSFAFMAAGAWVTSAVMPKQHTTPIGTLAWPLALLAAAYGVLAVASVAVSSVPLLYLVKTALACFVIIRLLRGVL
jgi:O-antigen/teichoic acid export membrane protein